MRGRRLGACLIVLTLGVVACEPGPTKDREPPKTVSLGAWVSGLCTALQRFGEDANFGRIADAVPFRMPRAPIDELVPAIRRLTASVDALGVPDIPGGPALRAGVVSRLRRSVAAAEQIQAAGGVPPSAQVIPGGVRSSAWSFAYPIGLFLLLGSDGTGPAKVAIYLEDPAAPAVVSELIGRLRARADVTRVEYQTKTEACREFKRTFAGIDVAEHVGCRNIRGNLEVTLAMDASASAVHDAFVVRPGVDDVVVQQGFEEFILDMTGLDDEDLRALTPVRDVAARLPECAAAAA